MVKDLHPLVVTPARGTPPLRTLGRYVDERGGLRPVASNATDRDGRRVVVPARDARTLLFLDLETGKETGSFVPKGLGLDINTHIRGVWLRPRCGIVVSERAIIGFDAAKQEQLFVIPTKDRGNDSIRCVALSASGDLLFFGTTGGMVRGWDLFKKRQVFSVHAHDTCERLAFGPDGKQLASSGDSEVKIWNIASKRCVAKLGGKSLPLRAAAFSHDGARVFAAAARDGGHAIHELALGKKKPLRTFEGHRAAVECLAVAPDGETLVSAGIDRTLHVWDLQTGRSRGMFEPPGCVTTCRIGQDGTILTFDSDGALCLWNLAAAQKDVPLPLDEVTHLAFEQTTFVAGYFDNTLRRGTVAKPAMDVLVADAKSDATMPNPPVVSLTADAKIALVARAQGFMEKWDLVKGKCTSRSDANGNIELLAVAPKGDRAAYLSVGGRRPRLSAWSLKKNERTGTLEERMNPASLVLPNEGKTALFIGRDHRVIELALDDFEGNPIRWEEGRWVGDFPVLVPDGERVVSKRTRTEPAVYHGDLLVETLGGKMLATHAAHDFEVTAVATTTTLCASGDSDGDVHVWKLEDGALVGRWHGPAVITALTFSRDGRLAAGDATGRVSVFELPR